MTLSPAAGVRGVLARLGWSLRRQGAGTGMRFVVSRGGRAFCDFSLDPAAGQGRSLTPASRLVLAPRPGAELSGAEKEGLSDLRAELGLMLELLRGEGAAPQGTAIVESHEGLSGRDLLMRTTFACNQRCPFCFVPLTGKAADESAIERELDAHALAPGQRGVLTFSGGEPALDKRLPRLIAAARARGFSAFGLQTNGAVLSRAMLDELVASGVDSYLFSFHSHKPALYDKITGSRGQFARAAASLERLLSTPGCRVTVNVVVNAWNYKDLPGLVDFIKGLRPGPRPLVLHTLYLSMMNEVGHQKMPSWTVPLEKARPYLRRAIARCPEAGLGVARAGGESSFPVCVLGDPERHGALRPMPQDRVRYAEDFSGEAGSVGRAKRPSCRACSFDPRCTGVPARYARLHGLSALRPL